MEPRSDTIDLARAMEQAAALYGSGDWSQAARLCRAILDHSPGHFDALHLAGIIAAQTGLTREAAGLLQRAVTVQPHNAVAHNNYGNVLRDLKRSDAALESFRRALQLQPDFANAYVNRGNALRDLKRLDEALGNYDQALRIQPENAVAWSSRGAVLQELRRPREALESCEHALRIQPDYAGANTNRGNVLCALQRWGEAVQSYSKALRVQPDLIEALNGLGNALRELERLAEALECYERAGRLRPNDALTLSNQAGALQDLQRFEEALDSCERAIRSDPDCAVAHRHRASILLILQRFDEAQTSAETALRLEPEATDAHITLACTLYTRQEPAAAIASLTRAITIQPNCAQAYRNRAHAHLLAGELAKGWVDNEWRWQVTGGMAKEWRDFPRPLWLGQESLLGKTILLHAEQGLGDTLQFCRYVKRVAALGAKPVLEVPAELARLLRTLDEGTQVVARGDALPAFDYHCPLLSLPLAFGTDLASIPAEVPYLRSDDAALRAWRARLGTRGKLRVGLAWAGGSRPNLLRWSDNRSRNIPLAKLAPLRHPRIEFVSLQKGREAESELRELVERGWEGPQLLSFSDQLNYFADTAALVENLDLVISVDTAVVHLAGALGKAVWLMNRYDTCWRWLLERTDSPWYPTLRLYRQDRPGDWEGVVGRISADLAQLADRFELSDPRELES